MLPCFTSYRVLPPKFIEKFAGSLDNGSARVARRALHTCLGPAPAPGWLGGQVGLVVSCLHHLGMSSGQRRHAHGALRPTLPP